MPISFGEAKARLLKGERLSWNKFEKSQGGFRHP